MRAEILLNVPDTWRPLPVIMTRCVMVMPEMCVMLRKIVTWIQRHERFV